MSKPCTCLILPTPNLASKTQSLQISHLWHWRPSARRTSNVCSLYPPTRSAQGAAWNYKLLQMSFFRDAERMLGAFSCYNWATFWWKRSGGVAEETFCICLARCFQVLSMRHPWSKIWLAASQQLRDKFNNLQQILKFLVSLSSFCNWVKITFLALFLEGLLGVLGIGSNSFG